ncbi:MAG TPA: transglutaminase domain-containing protein, partial [Leptospiraceae bacterium]|nr:transglutaminase domain-containing protein [Leptospiraceae bacterium]
MIRIKVALLLLLVCLSSLASQPQSQAAYDRGIDALYNQKQPDRALEFFREAYRLDPNVWSRPFMIGYTLNAYLNQPSEALPFLNRAWALNDANDELPYKETIQCLEKLQRWDAAIAKNQDAQKRLKAARKTIGSWYPENLAWLYWQKGDTTRALAIAPAGSWVRSQLAPRTIEFTWRLQLAKLLEEWRLTSFDKIRLSLPIDRPFQSLKSVSLTSSLGDSLKTRRVARRGNNFLELEKAQEDEWPAEVVLKVKVEQNLKNMVARPAGLQPARVGDENYEWAVENKDGLFSQDDPEFIAKVEEISRPGRTTGEKADLLLNYLRANFKYGKRVEGDTVHSWLKQGTGDCGYFTYIAIGMLRAIKVPVRGLYGIGPWTDPPPALPHSILEIYDASTGQWFPHDPQVASQYGIIDPSYVPLMAANPKQDVAVLSPDNVWELDTTWF